MKKIIQAKVFDNNIDIQMISEKMYKYRINQQSGYFIDDGGYNIYATFSTNPTYVYLKIITLDYLNNNIKRPLMCDISHYIETSKHNNALFKIYDKYQVFIRKEKIEKLNKL